MKGFASYRISLLILLFILQVSFTLSQNKIIDSLNKIVSSATSDSIKSLAYIELASNYFGYDTLKSDQSLQKAENLLRNKKWNYNRGYFYQAKSQIVFNRGHYDLSLLLADSSMENYDEVRESGDTKTKKEAEFQRAVVTADIGATYATMGRNEEGIKYYLEGLRMYESSDHPDRFGKIGTCYNNIATLYYAIQQFEKCLEYDVKAIPFHIQRGDNESIAFAYIFAASDFSMLKQFDSAQLYFKKALPYVNALNKPSVNIEYYGKTGAFYKTIKDWKTAIKFYTLAYNEAKNINDIFNQAALSRQVAAAYYFEGNISQAEMFGLQSLQVTDANNFVKEKVYLYELLSKIFEKKPDFKNAYLYLRKYQDITASTKQDELKGKVAELEAKYQSEAKKKDIIQLQKDKEIQKLSIRQKSTLNYILIAGLALLLLIVLLLVRNFRNKQKLSHQTAELQAQRIRELEQEKQLIAYNALLKGQEEERSRMAKDLHDGLGGMLSGVKLSLGAMKGNMILSEDSTRLFSKALDQLDNSIGEMRRVAHNLMPEALVRLGLQQALQDYCDNLNEAQQVRLNCQFYGLEKRLDAATEMVVYRIVQELVNNAVKHASASEILMQVMRHENNLNITIEDNGKGFDVAGLKHVKGAGLNNVRSRVEYLKGVMDIQSAPGRTSIHIDCSFPE